jgi:hypothetical protein
LGKKGKLEISGNYYIMPEGKISRIGKKSLPHQFYNKGEINMYNNYY